MRKITSSTHFARVSHVVALETLKRARATSYKDKHLTADAASTYGISSE